MTHRHLSNIDCLTARTACLVCFIGTVNGRSEKKEKKHIKTGASSGHIPNLRQSILESFDIHDITNKRHLYLYIQIADTYTNTVSIFITDYAKLHINQ